MKRIVAIALLGMLAASTAFAIFGVNMVKFAPLAGAGLRVDSTSVATSGAGSVVIDKVMLAGQATSTAATALLYVALAGNNVQKDVISTRTILYTFGAEEGVSGNWFNKEFTGPYICTADSPLVFHFLGTNSDSLSAVVDYHYAR